MDCGIVGANLHSKQYLEKLSQITKLPKGGSGLRNQPTFVVNSGMGHGHDTDHWLEAEMEFESLSERLGMAPYQEYRLRPHRDIQRDLTANYD